MICKVPPSAKIKQVHVIGSANDFQTYQFPYESAIMQTAALAVSSSAGLIELCGFRVEASCDHAVEMWAGKPQFGFNDKIIS